MKLNTNTLRELLEVYGLDMDTKRQRIIGTPFYKYCIYTLDGKYVGGYYPTARAVIVGDTTCFTLRELVRACEPYLDYEGV